jgi:hypothetical protein
VVTKLTKIQVQQLVDNKYVKDVKGNTIRFTVIFKEIFAEELIKGESPKEIFRKCDLNPTLIGEIRIKNFTRIINKKLSKSNSMEDSRKFNGKKPHIEAKKYDSLDDSEKVKILESELLEQQQINKLLKKNRELEQKYSI